MDQFSFPSERKSFTDLTSSSALRLSLLVFSILVAFFLTVYPGEAGEPRLLSPDLTENPAGCYRVSKSFPLSKSVNGIDGILQLLQDSRLPRNLYGKPFGTPFKDSYMDDKDVLPLFKDSPPLGAVLRIVSQRKELVLTEESHTSDDTPVAWLEEAKLVGKKPTYLLTRDFSMSMGSYNGPITFFYEVAGGELKPVEYLDAKTEKKEQIALMRSLKTNCKLVASTNGTSQDILRVACRSNFDTKSKDEGGFLVYYDRFHFDDRQWVKYENVERGYWEVDGEDFPSLSKFPVGN